jgi:S-adenosylmethionine:tRNA-ribosyltransferase-isomerase (queuine synthetase)
MGSGAAGSVRASGLKGEQAARSTARRVIAVGTAVNRVLPFTLLSMDGLA